MRAARTRDPATRHARPYAVAHAVRALRQLQERSYGFYGTICSAETLSLIGITSSVQLKVDICISGLSASGRMVYDVLRLLWRAPRNRERSIPAQCSLVAALCSSEVP